MAPDPFGLRGLHHVELYVGNARQAVWAYERLGFAVAAYRGLETGSRDSVSWLLTQGTARIVLTGALSSASPVAEHVARHGDSVVDVAFEVADAARAYQHATRRGADGLAEPKTVADDHGEATVAAIGGFGPVRHSLVSRGTFTGGFLPGYDDRPGPAADPGITEIDHVVAAVPAGRAEDLAAFYRDVLDFEQLHHFDDTQIATEYSALMNRVVADGGRRIKLPIVEPGRGERRSQVQEFLDYHEGPGVQHIALLTGDAVATVARWRGRGVDLLATPDTYYDALARRVPHVADRVEQLREARLLADCDDEGYLLQVFARTLHDRPTLFFEVIERQGARGFGEGNIRALYEALEREQSLRGNL